jgi:peroxiredoxin
MKKQQSIIQLNLLLIFLVVYTFNCSANPKAKRMFVVINIVLDDPSMIGRDSIQFSMSKNDINSNLEVQDNLYAFKLSTKSTRLIIPLTNSITYGRIIYIGNKSQAFLPLNHDNNLFLFQAEDTIEMRLSNIKIGCSFRGKNAARYNCMYEISNHNEINYAEFNWLCKLREFHQAYISLIKSRDSLYNFQCTLLHKYKKYIDLQIFNLIKIDCWADCNHQMVSACNTPYVVFNSVQYDAAQSIFLKYYKAYNTPSFAFPSLLVKSYKYADYLLDRELVFIVISKSIASDNYIKKIKFRDIDKAINSHYKIGSLRDKLKLLAFYNIDWARQSDYVYFIDNAIKDASQPIKNAIYRFKKSHTVGMPAFKFQMPDSTGKVYSLEDFNGKIAVVDFWFTGCKACTKMAIALQPIISRYKSNPDVVFVSVCIDRSKNTWMNSLKQEIYANKDEINLFEGMNGDSPFLKYYNVEEYPTIFVIGKDSKMISVTPPDPVTDALGFEKLINQNL